MFPIFCLVKPKGPQFWATCWIGRLEGVQVAVDYLAV